MGYKGAAGIPPSRSILSISQSLDTIHFRSLVSRLKKQAAYWLTPAPFLPAPSRPPCPDTPPRRQSSPLLAAAHTDSLAAVLECLAAVLRHLAAASAVTGAVSAVARGEAVEAAGLGLCRCGTTAVDFGAAAGAVNLDIYLILPKHIYIYCATSYPKDL